MANFPEDFKKSYKDKLLELDNLERENATDKSSLIKRSNLQRNLARLVFHESVKLYVISMFILFVEFINTN